MEKNDENYWVKGRKVRSAVVADDKMPDYRNEIAGSGLKKRRRPKLLELKMHVEDINYLLYWKITF
jgi:hypothetical protein